MELFISKRALLARFSRGGRLAFPHECGFIGRWGVEMPIQAIVTDVKLAADEPFGKRFLPLQNFGPRFEPDQFVFRRAAPEFLRRAD